MKKTIGIIGIGNIGQALAKHFVRAGYSIRISNSKGADTLKELAKKIGPNVTAASANEAAEADIIVLSVPWANMPDAIKKIPTWTGKIVVDTSNNILSMDPFKLADIGGKSTGELVANLMPGANLVKAFNTLPAALVASDPARGNGNRTIVYSGDDVEAKNVVRELIASTGFNPLDLGGLKIGGKMQDVGGPFSMADLLKTNNSVQESIEVVRRANSEVQGEGNWELYDQLYSDDLVNHTGLEGYSNDKAGVRRLYADLRTAFAWKPEIHWQISDGERVTTYKHYNGTHQGDFLGIKASGNKVHFEVIDVMAVRDGKITDHWGIGDFPSLMKQIGAHS